MASIRRTGGNDFPDKLKALVTGPPKSGKTTLLGTIPNIIIADTEPRANNLASLAHLDVPYVTIERSTDLRELLMILSNDSLREQAAASAGMDRIDAVAIDTLDTLQKILKRERMEDMKSSKFVRDDWAWLKEEMTKIIESFTALPLHVVFTVHIASKDVGTEQNPMTKFQPGLEGAIANDIAGMVGYSFRSFRKEEVDPTSGRFTKYWLQAEGDETYDFLGTRTAGRLPSFIEPDFKTVYDAAMAGRPAPTQPTPAAPLPEAPERQPQMQPQEGGPDSGPAQQQPEQAPAPQPPAERPADTEPVNDAALQHVKKVYDALQLPFPEAILRAKTLGDARQIVMMWQATQQDYAEGKGKEGSSPQAEMVAYLSGAGLMPTEADAAPPTKQVEPKIDGTIDEVKAWVGDGSDLARVNQAFEAERTGKNRTSLMGWLESKGASHGGPQPGVEQPEQVQTPVQTQPEPPTEPITPDSTPVDDSSTEEEAVQAVQDGLGGSVISETSNDPDLICGADGDPHEIDDNDIANISQTRFGKRLCVNHYIAATKSA